jgi:O-glycosyl hydrolase
MKIEHSPKTIKLNGDYLHFWYANNKGRGTNNCTICRSTCQERASISKNQKEVTHMCKTSSWAGNVNFSRKVQNDLGIK